MNKNKNHHEHSLYSDRVVQRPLISLWVESTSRWIDLWFLFCTFFFFFLFLLSSFLVLVTSPSTEKQSSTRQGKNIIVRKAISMDFSSALFPLALFLSFSPLWSAFYFNSFSVFLGSYLLPFVKRNSIYMTIIYSPLS